MVPWGTPGRGFQRLDDLAAAGFRIAEVDSDDQLVAVRLERDEDKVTVVLTRADFAGMFPGFAGDRLEPERPSR